MPPLVSDFGRAIRRLFRVVRWVSFGFIGVVLVLLAFRIAEVYRAAAGVHPALGIAFLVVFAGAVYWLIGRPLMRFWKMPVTLRPPKLPPMEERTLKHLVKHLEFLEKYVAGLKANPEWTGDVNDVLDAEAACRNMREEADGAADTDLEALAGRVVAFEREVVERLLEPLDEKAGEVIRGEALRVGLATAVSPYGSLDAFLVLWRNVNLVSRIAVIYYGRPGTRGTLSILRDVSMATMVGAYMGDLAEVAGEALGSLVGKTAGFFAGPLMEGCLNAVATLRIGYVAKGRCRAFSAWTERTAVEATQAALTEAARFSAGLVTDIVKRVGGGVMQMTGSALSGLVDRITGLFHKAEPGTEPEPA